MTTHAGQQLQPSCRASVMLLRIRLDQPAMGPSLGTRFGPPLYHRRLSARKSVRLHCPYFRSILAATLHIQRRCFQSSHQDGRGHHCTLFTRLSAAAKHLASDMTAVKARPHERLSGACYQTGLQAAAQAACVDSDWFQCQHAALVTVGPGSAALLTVARQCHRCAHVGFPLSYAALHRQVLFNNTRQKCQKVTDGSPLRCKFGAASGRGAYVLNAPYLLAMLALALGREHRDRQVRGCDTRETRLRFDNAATLGQGVALLEGAACVMVNGAKASVAQQRYHDCQEEGTQTAAMLRAARCSGRIHWPADGA